MSDDTPTGPAALVERIITRAVKDVQAVQDARRAGRPVSQERQRNAQDALVFIRGPGLRNALDALGMDKAEPADALKYLGIE